MPSKLSSSGCSSASRKTCVPGCRLSRGILGRVATWMSHTSERATPITTPARTPAESTPTVAAVAIQKSTRATRCRRRSSVTSIMPKTTASMISAASTGFGRSEKSGARTTSVRITRAPVASEASGVRAPEDSLSELADRLVETGIPWNTPAPAFAIPWAMDSWLTSIR